MIIIGIGLEVLAAALGTISKQLIAYSAHANRQWIFNLGAFTNMVVGPLTDACAYGFAPQVIVAPFACLDVIFNMFLAPYTLSWQREHIGRFHIIGTILVAAGACLSASFGSGQAGNFTEDELKRQLLMPQSLAYMIAEGVCLLFVGASLKMKFLRPQWRGIALGCMAGVLMGNVFFLKGFIGIVGLALASGNWEAFLRPVPYVCIAASAVCSFIGHLVMRKGLAEYKGVYMVTIFEGAHITAGCLSGCIIMSEMHSAPWWRWCCYWASVTMIIAGILCVNRACGARVGASVLVPQTRSPSQTPVAGSIWSSPSRASSFGPFNGVDPLPSLGSLSDNMMTNQTGSLTPPISASQLTSDAREFLLKVPPRPMALPEVPPLPLEHQWPPEEPPGRGGTGPTHDCEAPYHHSLGTTAAASLDTV